MPYTFVPRSAKNAKVRINNTIFTARIWTVTPRAAESDTTNFETGGQDDVETNTVGLDVEIEADADGNINPYDVTLNLVPGQNVAAKLYLNDTAGPFWNIPTLKILTAPNTADPKKMVGIKITGKAKPGWAYPLGGTF
jgi:hypothetical protein